MHRPTCRKAYGWVKCSLPAAEVQRVAKATRQKPASGQAMLGGHLATGFSAIRTQGAHRKSMPTRNRTPTANRHLHSQATCRSNLQHGSTFRQHEHQAAAHHGIPQQRRYTSAPSTKAAGTIAVKAAKPPVQQLAWPRTKQCSHRTQPRVTAIRCLGMSGA